MPKKAKMYSLLPMMVVAIKKQLMLFLLCCCAVSLSAQQTDLQLRFTPSISYRINKKWKVGFDYRLAMYKDMSTFKSSMFQLAAEYKIIKRLSLEIGYRFTTAFANDAHRFMATLQYQYKINDEFTLTSGTRYQFTTQSLDWDFMQNYKEPSQYIRQKVTLDYNIPHSKISLYAAPELFLRLDKNPVAFHRMRYHAGVNYDLKYGNSVGLAVFYEDVFKANKDDRFVVNIKYGLSIDDLIKKLKKDKKKGDKDEKDKDKKDGEKKGDKDEKKDKEKKDKD